MRYVVAALLLAGGAARVQMSDLKYDVVLLGDPVAARDDKLRAVDELTAAELRAAPLLVERLQDTSDAVFLDDYRVDTGPLNPGPPLSTTTTARFMCELILYRIIAPEPKETSLALGARASKTGLDAVRPAGGLDFEVPRAPVAWVRDWSAYWAAHKGESLDVIRRESAAAIDRLWREAALATTAAPTPGAGPAPHLPSATTGTAAALASSTAGMLLDAWQDPALTPAREAYVKARAIFREAEGDVGKRKAARKQLEDMAHKEPRLRVHVERWLAKI